jgi:DNA-binding NarL/FixJ family response regulator
MRDRKPTPAQLKVLKLIAKGKHDYEIAALLSIAPATAKTQANSLLSRMGVHTRAQAVALAYEWGVLP